MTLDDIGFYTLTDRRAKVASHTSLLTRCELVLTDRRGDMDKQLAHQIVVEWISRGLGAIRFSGGEPTLWEGLLQLVERAKAGGVGRIALSTNGSASWDTYEALLGAGVDDFSISLDACCAKTATWAHVVDIIARLAAETYTTVGITLGQTNVAEAAETVHLAHVLGVDDIRVIPLETEGFVHCDELAKDLHDIIEDHPILKYRLRRLESHGSIRGLLATDTDRCPLVLDDCAVAGSWHFPCIIYLRKGGDPIGPVADSGWRHLRRWWAEGHSTQSDEICRSQCLDVCVDYNNRWKRFHREDGGE